MGSRAPERRSWAEIASGGDRREHAPAPRPVAAERVETSFVLRAALDVVDARIEDAESAQLAANREAKVDERRLAGRSRDHRHPRAGGRDRHGDVVTYLEAASADARTNRGDDRAPSELFDAAAHHARDHAAPSRMDRHDVARSAVAHEHGHTVRDANADGGRTLPGRAATRAADHCVGLTALRLRGFDDARAVHLSGAGDPKRPEGKEKIAIVGPTFGEGVGETGFPEPLRLQERHADR